MEIIITAISIIVGALCGVLWAERRDRAEALEEVRQTDKLHKEAVKALADIQEKVIKEHTSLVDKMNSLEHILANRKSEPILKRF